MNDLLKLFLRAARHLPLVFVLLAATGAESAAYGQTPTGGNPREVMERFARRAAHLVPQVLESIEQPLFPYFVLLAWVLAGLVGIFAFLRLVRHQEGTTSDMVWWFTRMAICLAFMLGTNDILGGLAGIGHHIAYGEDSTSFLARLVDEQEYSFNVSYQKFLENHFVVHVEDVDIHVDGSNDTFHWLGVLTPGEGKLEDVIRSIDPQSYSFETLFSSFSISRTIMEAGDLFLIVLSYVVMFALRLSAPFAVALAIDRQFSGRIFQNFVWGAVVLTLVMPIVCQVMRIVIYAFGNVAMAIGDGDPLYRWDPETLSVISGGGNPWYTIMLASGLMLILGLSFFAAPYIAYKLTIGQVFEGVSQVTAGWMAAVASTGVEMFSTAGAAAINRQAENTVAQGQADAGRVEAEANRDAQTQRIDGQAIMSKAGNNAAAFTSASAAMADGRMGAQMAHNNRDATNLILGLAAQREIAENDVTTGASVNHRRIENGQFSQNTALGINNEVADMEGGFFRSVHAGGGANVGVGKTFGAGGGREGSVGANVGVGGDVTGAWATRVQGLGHIENAQRGAEVFNQGTNLHILNDTGSNTQRNEVIAATTAEIQHVNEVRAERDAGAAMDAAHAKAGAAYGGAAIANQGVERWHDLATQAEGTVFDGQMRSIDINLAAAQEASRLRAQAAILSQFGHSVAQRVDEMGDQLRY